ncbi:MAG: 5'-methylthioadenosine/S-adenosylhomocysteine nucleosidase [Alphaproteobacteria bacterium]
MHTGWRASGHGGAPDLSRVGDKRVLYVMATEQEYTRHLRAKIDPLITGVGPIEAAAALGATLGVLAAKDALPDLIVALGSAGSRTLDHAGLYQASSVFYRDMDCSPLGFARGVTPFSTEPAILPLGPMIPGIRTAMLASGASIISGDGYTAVDADMVDMETYSYARVARLFGKPLISLRGISDGRAPLTGISDWTDTLEQIGASLADALDQLKTMLKTAP